MDVWAKYSLDEKIERSYDEGMNVGYLDGYSNGYREGLVESFPAAYEECFEESLKAVVDILRDFYPDPEKMYEIITRYPYFANVTKEQIKKRIRMLFMVRTFFLYIKIDSNNFYIYILHIKNKRNDAHGPRNMFTG